MHDGLEFVGLVKEQMGVEIFMFAGWQDERGNVKKAKQASVTLLEEQN